MTKKDVVPEEILDLLEYYQEMMIKHSDIDHTKISNEKSKFILGSVMRLPKHLQTRVIYGMEKLGYIERENQKIILIKSSS